MRRLIICFSLGLIAGMSEPAAAQVPPAPSRTGQVSELTFRPPRPRVRKVRTEAQVLQHRKAVVLAEQRVARIESRKWYGVSLSRPFMPSWTSNSLDLNAALLAPSGGWYVGPMWWP